MIEQWSSSETLHAHTMGNSAQQFGDSLAHKLQGMLEVVVLSPLPAGDPHLGTIR